MTAVDGTLLTLSPNRRRNGSIVKADADDGFIFSLHFENGVIAEMVAMHGTHYTDEASISVYGSDGVLITPQQGFNPPAHGTVLGAQLGRDPAPAPLPIPAELEPFSDERDDRLMPFRILTREFLRGIKEGTSPAPSFADGLACQQVLDAVRESSATGRRVRISHTESAWSDRTPSS